MTSFTDKKSPTTEDASLNITDKVSTGSKNTDVPEQGGEGKIRKFP